MARGGLADVMSSITGTGDPAPGPDNKQYKKIQEDAASNAGGLYSRGREYKVDAPTIENKYQEGSRDAIKLNTGEQRYLGQHLRDVMEGRDTTGAQAVQQQGIDRSIQAQMAAARSARGAGGQAAAMRAAQGQAAQLQGQSAAQAAQLQAQLASDAAKTQAGVYANIGSQLGQQYGLEQQSAIEQARMKQEAEAQRQRMELGLTGLSQQARQQQLLAMYQQGQLSLEQYKAQVEADKAAGEAGGGILGAGIGAAAGLMMMSDDKAKTTSKPDFSAVNFSGGGGVGNSMASGFQGGMRLGQGVGSMFGSSTPAVGSDAWAQQVNTQATPDYQPMTGPAVAPSDPNAPAGPNSPQWLDQYMSGDNTKVDPMAMAAVMKSFKSDDRSKLDKVAAHEKGSRVVDQFLDSIRPLAYHYKDPADEPRQPPSGGMYAGVSAQDMERSPVGPQIVVDTPRGKTVNTRAAVSAALAGLARLNERLEKVERKGGR